MQMTTQSQKQNFVESETTTVHLMLNFSNLTTITRPNYPIPPMGRGIRHEI